ncbi:MAG: hypothetical protein M1822_000725 [Bathelium mastoideum]|nr:MAG: hypothetical protein M1822_000725 [Bathelium mastoideum]
MSSSKPPSPFSSYLISPHELHTALQSSNNPRLVPLCGTWFLPNDPQKRTGRATYLQRRISGARFFDLDAISDTTSPYPHMLPTRQHFARCMSQLGLRNADTLVVYDSAELGIFSAPRVAWQLRVLGHRGAVHVLDNFKVWVEEGLPTEGPGEPGAWEETVYEVPAEGDGQGSGVVEFEEVRERARKGEVGRDVQVLDARSEGRWKGVEPEPRPGEEQCSGGALRDFFVVLRLEFGLIDIKGLSSGHIPGSVSVPVPELLDPKTKNFLSSEQLRALFEKKGVDASKPIISSCGTGVTATIIDTALEKAGYSPESQRKVYDGSWT